MRSVAPKTETLADPLQIRPQVQVFREHVRLEELPVAHDLSSPCMGAR